MRRSRLVPAATLAVTLLAGTALAGCTSGGRTTGPSPSSPASASASPSGSAQPTAPRSPSASPTTPYPSPASASGKAVSLYDFIEFWGTTPRAWRRTSPSSRHAGVTWARLRLASSPDAADRFAAVVAAAARHHIQLIVILEKPAPLLDLGTPADQQAYRTWVAQIVQRYRASVHYWEILSEPNLRYTWNIDSKHDSDQQAYLAAVQRYVTLLKQGYETVKATDPTATVLFGGLSEAKVERYLRAVMTTDASRYFDIMDFHAYGQTPDSVLSRYRSFRRSMHSQPGLGRQADLGGVRLQLLLERQGRLLRDRGAEGAQLRQGDQAGQRGRGAGADLLVHPARQQPGQPRLRPDHPGQAGPQPAPSQGVLRPDGHARPQLGHGCHGDVLLALATLARAGRPRRATGAGSQRPRST